MEIISLRTKASCGFVSISSFHRRFFFCLYFGLHTEEWEEGRLIKPFPSHSEVPHLGFIFGTHGCLHSCLSLSHCYWAHWKPGHQFRLSQCTALWEKGHGSGRRCSHRGGIYIKVSWGKWSPSGIKIFRYLQSLGNCKGTTFY